MRTLVGIFLFFFVLSFFTFPLVSYAQPPLPSGARPEMQEKKLDEEVTRRRPKKPEEEEEPEIVEFEEMQIPEEALKKRFKISQIDIDGNTLVKDEELEELATPYKGKEDNLADLQRLADEITACYRKKGYITSFAFLPPQKIENETVRIQVVEGTLASLSVQGNKWFRADLIKRGIHIKKGDVIYYPKLRRDLARINANADRSVQAVLMPGIEKGTSDVILKTKDSFPFHPFGEWNNQGTAYTGRFKYTVGFIDNNFSTFDDIAQVAVQLSNDLFGIAVTESFPINSYGGTLNFLYSFARTAPKQDLTDYDVVGKSSTYSFSINQPIFSEDKWGFGVRGSFDYKRSKTTLLATEYSHDDPRVIRFGMNANIADPWGNNFIDQQFSWGLPNFMGGSGRENNDGSRRGVGNDFFKSVTSYVRYQPVPFLPLLENAYITQTLVAQLCHRPLMPAEEYYLGGANTVRGYTEGDSPGDEAFLTKTDLIFQLPFIPKDWKLPFSEIPFKQQLNGVLFVDVGLAVLKHTKTYEEPYRKLIGWGTGLRVRLYDDFYARVEFGFPAGNMPDDRRDYQVHFTLRKEFF